MPRWVGIIALLTLGLPAEAATVKKLFKGGKAQVEADAGELAGIAVGTTVELRDDKSAWTGEVYKIKSKNLLYIKFEDRGLLDKGMSVSLVALDDGPAMAADSGEGLDLRQRHPGSLTYNAAVQELYRPGGEFPFHYQTLGATVDVERDSAQIADLTLEIDQSELRLGANFRPLPALLLGTAFKNRQGKFEIGFEGSSDKLSSESTRNSVHLFSGYSLPFGLDVALEYEIAFETIDAIDFDLSGNPAKETYSYTYDKIHPSLMFRKESFDVGLSYSPPVKLKLEKEVENADGEVSTETANTNSEPAEISLFGQYIVEEKHGIQLSLTQVMHKDVEFVEDGEEATVKNALEVAAKYRFRTSHDLMAGLGILRVPGSAKEVQNSPTRVGYRGLYLEGQYLPHKAVDIGLHFGLAQGSEEYSQKDPDSGENLTGIVKIEFMEILLFGSARF